MNICSCGLLDLRFCRASLLALILTLGVPRLQAQGSPVAIVLAASPSPSTAQPGVTVVTLVTSSMPAGSITAANLRVTLQAASGSTGPALTAQVSAYAALPVNGGRITFQVQGPNVNSPTPYSVSVSGTTSTGVAFASTKPAILTVNPQAQLLSITPSAGQPGQTVQVSLTGQYTNYVQGSTSANFGAGISVGSGPPSGGLGQVTVTSLTTATAQLRIDPAATPGLRNVTVATGVQQAMLTNGFTVTAASPAPNLASVVPSYGQQGQSNLSLTITGQNTHFLQGATSVSLGSGDIAVHSVVVSTATSLVADITVTTGAIVGAYSVTASTGSEVVALSDGFTVTPGSITVNAGLGRTTVYPSGVPLAGSIQEDGSVPLPTLISTWSEAGVVPALPLTWFQPYPPGALPVGRYCHVQGYNPSTNRMVIYGGYHYLPPANATTGYPNDVWALTNANGLEAPPATWVSLIPPGAVGAPPSRVCAGGAFDSANDILIIFGGQSQGSNPFNDVWVLTDADGTTGTPKWTQLVPSGTAPVARRFSANSVAYDATNNRLIVFGGDQYSAAQPCCISLNDIWILTNANGMGGTPTWIQIHPSGPTPEADGPVGYDPAANRLVAFTSRGDLPHAQNEIWVLTFANGLGGASQWVQLLPSNMPTPRFNPSVTYDAKSNQLVLYGGCDNQCSITDGGSTFNELWALANADGTGGASAWTQLLPLNSPSHGRLSAEAAFDATNNRLIVFGGQLAPTTAAINEAWVLNWAAPRPSVASFTSPNSAATIAFFGSPGAYSLQLSASDGLLDGAARTSVTVLPANGPPQVSAGSPITVTAPATIQLSGQASDDGVPLGSPLTTTWSLVSGPGTVTFSSPNSLSTRASFPAIGSYVLALNANDGELTTTSYVSVVVGSSPALISAIPGIAVQGQTGTAITVTGQNTHFAQGSTQLSFGSDIIVNSLTVTNAASLTANMTVSAGASVGGHTLTVTTGSEVVSLPEALTVTSASGLPMITTVSPNSGSQGQGGSVGIVGLNTHFVQGVTQVSFGPGITVSNINITCSTCLTVQLQIAVTAAPGPVTLTVTTGLEVATLVGGFTVLAGTPFISSFGPTTAPQGAQNVTLTVNGQFTHWAQGTTQVSLGSGVTVGSIAVTSATNLTAQLSIDPAAGVGTRILTVTTGVEVVSIPNVFTVQTATPVLYTLNPSGGTQGQQNVPVIITGLATRFVQGASVAAFGAGITVTSLTVPSATSATATINIDPTATPGTRTVTITTGSEVASFTNGFTVSVSPPIVYSLNPGGASQGSSNLQVQITGLNTHFVQGTSVASFGAGITVTALTVSNPTTATATLNIDDAAAIGPRTVTVTTGSEAASFVNGFSVVAGVPGITQISPGIGSQGVQNLSLAVTAQFTHFVQGTTTAAIGAGVTVNSVTVTDSLHLSLSVSVSTTAATGSRTVTITTGSEVVSAPGGFVVSAGTPTLLSVNPISATQGQQNVNVTITGQLTNFVQGTSSVSFGGAGITVNSVTVASGTSLTANISLASSATAGTRTVTVTTGSEVDSLANAFTVQPAGNQPPVITIASTWSVVLPNSLTLTYSVADPGLIQGGTLTDTWSTVSGPAAVGFQNQTPTSITANFALAGSYVLQISATDTFTQLTTTQNVTVTVTGTLPAPPTVSITSPTDGIPVTTLTNVVGSVASPALSSWTLEFHMQNESFFRPIATGTTAVTNAILGTFDPTLLLNGLAIIQLRATDTAGQTTTFGPISVVVMGNQKIGNFTVSFNDLTVPVAGLPIQVVRTYDSRNKTAGDFGVGWRLDLTTVTLATNGALGNNWVGTNSGGLFANYCVNPSSSHVVTITFADGTVFQFQPTLVPACQQLAPPSQTNVTFTLFSTTPPNASLAIVGSNLTFIDGSFPGAITLLDLDDVTTFDPDLYQLTMPDGRVLRISQSSGLQSVTDPDGNKLTVSASGITHSSGKSVAFLRDQTGRITQITDPNGNKILYGYDTSNDLTGVTDAAGNTSTFTYDANHGLLTIVDPAGVQPIKNVYDSSGRLIQHIDAFGNTINYTNNLAAQQEIVTDRLGNVTANYYDANGNIVQVTDALGGNTKRTYDANNNLLTETNPLNETRTYTYDANNNRLTETDPLGHKTTYTYNSRNQVLTIADPLGHLTTNVYDANGNLLSTKDPAGNTTTYAYNSAGLRTSMTDALGNVTGYQYDASGNLTQQTDALGHATTYTYDANGNKLSQTQTRTTSSGPQTMVTSYQYDADNRLTKTIYPDGSSTQTAYNLIGKQSVATDQLSRQTSYQYDLMGRLTQTTYADGTNESSAYDAEGDRITSIDRAGRSTSYSYDALKRLVQTTYADSAKTGTTYDAAGEVTAVADARGNATKYQYDAGGRRIAVVDAQGHTTGFTFDAAGNQTSLTDANGHTSQYQYDADNRRTKVVYPDGTADSTAYDALGRTVSKTDQAGRITQYGYDKIGRLIQVTDALSQLTGYTYDEVGNRLTQTDANGHSTAFAYDNLGRRILRSLPLGMSETSTYDLAGNLHSKTDFNGKTTSYGYDTLNRLLTKTPDASLGQPAVHCTYSATGQRLSMIDASGTTTYSYDLRDRLLQKATPEGTLTYTYDAAGNLLSIRSSNTGGTSVNYVYDALNRLSTVTDNRLASGTTTYAYDNAGNLQSYLYPNGMQSLYGYDALNRLTNLALSKGGTIASYGYTLGASGNRTAVVEFGGRQVNYTYDALYRLTGETIAGGSVSGAIGYTYDPVGNRLTRTSTVGPVPAATSTYDANDRLSSDTYDGNGSTTASGGNTYAYDFESHLVSQNGGAVSIIYDGDGNRVSKTAGAATTKYLVDDRNLTGYAQVLEELIGGTVQRVYTYGLNRISQSQASGTSFYGYDGHGSVRILTDSTGAVTDRYDYDAFGNILSQAGATPNVYLFSGEQNDPNLALYYLRARYMSQATGRFWTADSYEGALDQPLSLTLYPFAHSDPILYYDPSGHQALALGEAIEISALDILAPAGFYLGVKGLSSVLSKVRDLRTDCPISRAANIGIAVGVLRSSSTSIDIAVGTPETGGGPSAECHCNVTLKAPPSSAIAGSGGIVNVNYRLTYEAGLFSAALEYPAQPLGIVPFGTFLPTPFAVLLAGQVAPTVSGAFFVLANWNSIHPNPFLILPELMTAIDVQLNALESMH
jgi:RHS repeat-associated protein